MTDKPWIGVPGQLKISPTPIPLLVQVYANLRDYQMWLVPTPSHTSAQSFSRGEEADPRLEEQTGQEGLTLDIAWLPSRLK